MLVHSVIACNLLANFTKRAQTRQEKSRHTTCNSHYKIRQVRRPAPQNKEIGNIHVHKPQRNQVAPISLTVYIIRITMIRHKFHFTHMAT